MQDEIPTKSQLLHELAELQQRGAELKTPETEYLSASSVKAGELSAAAAKLRERMLLASETRYRRLFEAAQDGILILDANTGQITDVNPFLTNLLGYSHTDLVGKMLWEIGPFKNVQKSQMAFAELQSKEYIRYDDLPLVTYDGQHIDVEFISNVYLVNNQRVIQCNIRDITKHKQAQEALHDYTEQLAAQNAELDAFAHTVAHDLKGPISIITGFAELLSTRHETILLREHSEDLRLILHTGRKMDAIIEELMLLTGVRKQAVVIEPLDMHRVVREAMERLQILIQNQQAQISLRDAATWPVAWGYAPWIEEVWVNYLNNAIKYGGRPPQVEVGATPHQDGKVRFWMRDNGPGLSAEAQRDLFTPFTRLEQVRIKGHGLGLSIVRRIVEKLGGQVGIESVLGQGSTFFFTLPTGELPAPQITQLAT